MDIPQMTSIVLETDELVTVGALLLGLVRLIFLLIFPILIEGHVEIYLIDGIKQSMPPFSRYPGSSFLFFPLFFLVLLLIINFSTFIFSNQPSFGKKTQVIPPKNLPQANDMCARYPTAFGEVTGAFIQSDLEFFTFVDCQMKSLVRSTCKGIFLIHSLRLLSPDYIGYLNIVLIKQSEYFS
jgi:hypothetical protein